VRGADVVAALAANRPREAAPPASDGDRTAPPAQLRASSLTLVVFAPSLAERARAGRTVAHVAGRHPARVILVGPDPEASADGIDARIRVEGQARAGAPVVRYEELTLGMRRVSSRHLASLVGALLVEELPVFLWHMGVLPWGPTWQAAWAENVDRLIVDSGATESPLDDLEALAAFSAAEVPFGVGDMSFARLRPWRLGLAEIFQPRARRRLIERIEGVEIAYPAGPEAAVPAVGALLLAGWLAARLGWGRARAGGTDYAVCERVGGDVRLVFSPVEEGAGGLMRSGVGGVTLYVRGLNEGTPGVIALDPAPDGLAWSESAAGAAGRIVVDAVDDADALAQNLDLAPDPVFDESLARAAEISRALRRAVEQSAEGSDPDAWS
jgi:glucose-6-phosphate dehydrogenase assembly protein OpcA